MADDEQSFFVVVVALIHWFSSRGGRELNVQRSPDVLEKKKQHIFRLESRFDI